MVRDSKERHEGIPKIPANATELVGDRRRPLYAARDMGGLGAEQALYLTSTALDGEPGYFTTRQVENLGGVALFKAELPVAKGLEYTFLLYPNPMARTETTLPAAFVEAFRNAKAAPVVCMGAHD